MRLNHNAMSNDQLREKLKLMEQNLKDLTFKYLKDSKALAQLHGHEVTWDELLELVGTHNIPVLRRIFKNSKCRNWSMEQLL